MSAIRVERIEGVGDLLSLILKSTNSKQSWIYRGHADASWKTTSSAWRFIQSISCSDGIGAKKERFSQAWDSFLACLYTRCDTETRSHIDLYRKALHERNAIGSNTQKLTHWEHQAAGRHPTSIGNLDSLESGLMSIAQHYGFPTPLIDFSSNPLVALYFAARNSRDCEFSVLALDYGSSRTAAKFAYAQESLVLSHHIRRSLTEKGLDDDELSLSAVWPFSSEDTLYEMTTFCRINEWMPGLFRTERQRSVLLRSSFDFSLEEQLEYLHKFNQKGDHLAIKYVFPGLTRTEVMKSIKTLGVTAWTLFPDVEGCAMYAQDCLAHLSYENANPPIFSGFFAGLS